MGELKEKISQFFLRREKNKATSRVLGRKINDVLLIVNKDNSTYSSWQKAFPKARVKLLMIDDEALESKELAFETIFCPKDFNWIGKIRMKNMLQFNEHFDLIINETCGKDIRIDFLNKMIEADLKIAKFDKPYINMVLRIEEHNAFKEELLKYINTII